MKVVVFYLTDGTTHSMPLKDQSKDYVDLIGYINGDFYYEVESEDGTKMCINAEAVNAYIIGEGKKQEEA